MSRITDDLDATGVPDESAPPALDAAVAGADVAAVRAAASVLADGGDVATAARAALAAVSANDAALSAIVFSTQDASTTAWSTSKNTKAIDVVHAIASFLGALDETAARATLPTGVRFVVPTEPLWGGYRGHVVFLPANDCEALAVAVSLRILEEVVEPEPEEPAALHAVVESLRHAVAAIADSPGDALTDRSIERAIAHLGDVATHGAQPESRVGRSLALVDSKGNACVLAYGPELAGLPVPAIVDRGGRPWVLVATEVESASTLLGLAHAVVDRRVDPSVAVASARFALGPGAELVFEADVEPHLRDGLVARGHDVRTVSRSNAVVSLVIVDEAFRRHAIADARVQGEAQVLKSKPA